MMDTKRGHAVAAQNGKSYRPAFLLHSVLESSIGADNLAMKALVLCGRLLLRNYVILVELGGLGLLDFDFARFLVLSFIGIFAPPDFSGGIWRRVYLVIYGLSLRSRFFRLTDRSRFHFGNGSAPYWGSVPGLRCRGARIAVEQRYLNT